MTDDDDIRVRPARAEDAAALVAVLRDTFERTWRPHLTVAAAEAYVGEDRAAAYVAQEGHAFWVAERGGAVAGLVHWRGDFVHALHVRGDHTRRGVGARLMERAEAAMRADGVGLVRLETDTFNLASQAF